MIDSLQLAREFRITARQIAPHGGFFPQPASQAKRAGQAGPNRSPFFLSRTPQGRADAEIAELGGFVGGVPALHDAVEARR